MTTVGAVAGEADRRHAGRDVRCARSRTPSFKVDEDSGSDRKSARPCAIPPYLTVCWTCQACGCAARRCPHPACSWWTWRCVGSGWSARTAATRRGRVMTPVRWPRRGGIWQRVAASELDPDRLAGLVTIGVDEVSWRKHHHYLTLVTDHGRKKIVWGKPGKDTATLDAFFAELGNQRAAGLDAVSMDMGPAFARSVRTHAPQATIAIDPFHAVKLVTDALDTVRRAVWQQMRATDPTAAHKFKGARWALLKRPDHLTDDQAGTLRKLRHRGGQLWRAYTLREAFRAIFAGDLNTDEVTELLDRWIAKASRSRIDAMVKTAKTIRKHRDGILTAIGC